MKPMLTQPSWEKLPSIHFTGFPDFQLSKESHLLAVRSNSQASTGATKLSSFSTSWNLLDWFWGPWKEKFAQVYRY